MDPLNKNFAIKESTISSTVASTNKVSSVVSPEPARIAKKVDLEKPFEVYARFDNIRKVRADPKSSFILKDVFTLCANSLFEIKKVFFLPATTGSVKPNSIIRKYNSFEKCSESDTSISEITSEISSKDPASYAQKRINMSTNPNIISQFNLPISNEKIKEAFENFWANASVSDSELKKLHEVATPVTHEHKAKIAQYAIDFFIKKQKAFSGDSSEQNLRLFVIYAYMNNPTFAKLVENINKLKIRVKENDAKISTLRAEAIKEAKDSPKRTQLSDELKQTITTNTEVKNLLNFQENHIYSVLNHESSTLYNPASVINAANLLEIDPKIRIKGCKSITESNHEVLDILIAKKIYRQSLLVEGMLKDLPQWSYRANHLKPIEFYKQKALYVSDPFGFGNAEKDFQYWEVHNQLLIHAAIFQNNFRRVKNKIRNVHTIEDLESLNVFIDTNFPYLRFSGISAHSAILQTAKIRPAIGDRSKTLWWNFPQARHIVFDSPTNLSGEISYFPGKQERRTVIRKPAEVPDEDYNFSRRFLYLTFPEIITKPFSSENSNVCTEIMDPNFFVYSSGFAQKYSSVKEYMQSGNSIQQNKKAFSITNGTSSKRDTASEVQRKSVTNDFFDQNRKKNSQIDKKDSFNDNYITNLPLTLISIEDLFWSVAKNRRQGVSKEASSCVYSFCEYILIPFFQLAFIGFIQYNIFFQYCRYELRRYPFFWIFRCFRWVAVFCNYSTYGIFKKLWRMVSFLLFRRATFFSFSKLYLHWVSACIPLEDWIFFVYLFLFLGE